MELDFLLVKLTFAGNSPLAYPAATVRVQPAGPGDDLKPFIDVAFGLTGATRPGAAIEEVAAYAVQAARGLVQASQAAALLQLRLDDAQQAQAEIAQRYPLTPPTP